MPNDGFWKRLVIFSMTLLIGTLSSDFFGIYKKLESVNNPSEEVSVSKTATNFSDNKSKNCVPENENLKYRNLPFDKSEEDAKFQNLPHFERKKSIAIDKLLGLNTRLLNLESELEELNNSDSKKITDLQRQKKAVEAEIDKLLENLESPEFKSNPKELNTSAENLLHLEKCFHSK